MEYKMCCDGIVGKSAKAMGETINHLKEYLPLVQLQMDNISASTPDEKKLIENDLLYKQESSNHYLKVLESAYFNLLGVEYESEQTYEVSKDGMKSLLDCTLYRRGIMEVEYEDIEPRNGVPYVRLYWREHVIEDWRRKSKR